MSGSQKVVHELLKNVSWLVGHWRTETAALCHYPTMKGDVNYFEHLDIISEGAPYLSYTSYTFHADTKKPMHKETGFIRVNPDEPSRVALILSHINGLAEVEEGEADATSKTLSLESHTIGRLSFGKLPACTKINRRFKLIDENTLEQAIDMATTDIALTEHLRAVYKRRDGQEN